MGHTGKAKKATSRFFFTPWAAGDLTLTGYAVATLSPKIWYDVATTFTVAPAPVPASVVRPAPEPERMRVLFGTEITLRSVNFTKFRDPHNDLPSQAGRYFTEKAFLDFSSSTIGWALFTGAHAGPLNRVSRRCLSPRVLLLLLLLIMTPAVVVLTLHPASPLPRRRSFDKHLH